MEFSDDSLKQRRSLRLQEVARMEDAAVGRFSGSNMMILDTSLHSSSSTARSPQPIRRCNTLPSNSTSLSSNSTANRRRPSDTEIRSLWRLRVGALKMDESGHSINQ